MKGIQEGESRFTPPRPISIEDQLNRKPATMERTNGATQQMHNGSQPIQREISSTLENDNPFKVLRKKQENTNVRNNHISISSNEQEGSNDLLRAEYDFVNRFIHTPEDYKLMITVKRCTYKKYGYDYFINDIHY